MLTTKIVKQLNKFPASYYQGKPQQFILRLTPLQDFGIQQ